MVTRSLVVAIDALVALGVALAVLISAPTRAAAQAPPPPTMSQGIFGGFGLHGGEISCSGDMCNDFREAAGFNAQVGWGFGFGAGPKVGVVGDFWMMINSEDNLQMTHSIATIGARYWVIPALWLQGGLGGARATFTYDAPSGASFEDHTEIVPAVLFAVGLDFFKTSRFSIDVELRFGYGFYKRQDETGAEVTGRSTGLGVGFSWY